jgi:hypothetical protein
VSEERLAKTDAIAKAEAAYAVWREFLTEQAAAGRAELKGADGWTLAEATAHVSHWQVWAVERLRGILAGQKGERLNVDGKNAGWAKEDRGIEFEPALERMDKAWADLRKAARAVPDEKWRRLIIAVLAANTWEHYDEHLAWRPGAR